MNATSLWDYTPSPNLTDDQKWGTIRHHRNLRISQSDWTQLPDAVLTVSEKTAWLEYRQALRDLPQEFENPDEVTFPDPPIGTL